MYTTNNIDIKWKEHLFILLCVTKNIFTAIKVCVLTHQGEQ